MYEAGELSFLSFLLPSFQLQTNRVALRYVFALSAQVRTPNAVLLDQRPDGRPSDAHAARRTPVHKFD